MPYGRGTGARLQAPYGAPSRPLLNPMRRRTAAALALALLLPLPGVAGEVVVKRGETLSEIADRYGTSVNRLMEMNGLRDANDLWAGSRIKVPGNVYSGGGSGNYTVKAGETLSEIADRYGTSVDRLVRLNGLRDANDLWAGSRIQVPGASARPRVAVNKNAKTHQVQPGESLSAIADRYGVSMQRLIAINGISNPNQVMAGSTLVLRSTSKPKPKPQPVAAKPKPKPAVTVATKPKPRTSVGAAGGAFQSRPLDQDRLAILGQPVGSQGWKLLVLEQLKPAPRCWEERRDGLVDPALNRFDFSGICSRYLDSNGYSLRIGNDDVANRYRLRLKSQGNALVLLALTDGDPTEFVVGRGTIPLRDRNGFVALKLEPGWALERRMYGERSLSHVYFANSKPLAGLIAEAKRDQARPVAASVAATATTTAATVKPEPAKAEATKREDPKPAATKAAVAKAQPSSNTAAGSTPDWRSYGPLQVDWANWQSMGGSYVAPSLNSEGQPLYLAINCNAKRLNATGQSGAWKTWDAPQSDFEQKLITDLCRAKPG